MRLTLQSPNKKIKSNTINFIRIAFSILVLALVLEIIFGFPIHLEMSSEDSPVSGPKDLSQVSGAEQKMTDVHLVESQAGRRDWEMYAEAADGYQGRGTWELKNVKVLFYSKDKVEFTVTGRMGKIDAKTKDMNISGNVVTTSTNGYRFEAPVVDYIAKTRTLTSAQAVKMVGPADEKGNSTLLTGEQMETQVDSKIMRIRRHVKATRQLDGGRKFQIVSEGAEFTSDSLSAHFFDQVSVEMDTMKMEGPDAIFEFDKGKNFLQSILVNGGVKMTDVDKYATSDKVKFEPIENKFILSGKPRVVQENDEILGDQIVFIDGGKKVKVENIRARMDKE